MKKKVLIAVAVLIVAGSLLLWLAYNFDSGPPMLPRGTCYDGYCRKTLLHARARSRPWAWPMTECATFTSESTQDVVGSECWLYIPLGPDGQLISPGIRCYASIGDAGGRVTKAGCVYEGEVHG